MRIPTQLERPWLPVMAVFVASVLATLLFWAVLPASFRMNGSSDYRVYYEPVARNVLAGHGIVLADGAPATRTPPGYALLLAGVFGLSDLLGISEEVALSAFVLLCIGLGSVFVFSLARSVWGPSPALISCLAWMTYPLALWLTKQPNSEIPFISVFYGSFCLFWYALLRKSRAWPLCFLSGFLIGFAMLIRPIAIGLGFVFGVLLWLIRREMTACSRLLLIAILLLGNLVAILPWEAWVYTNTGRVVFLSTLGIPALRDGLTFAVDLRDFRQGVKVPQDVAALMEDLVARYDELQSLGDIILVMTEEFRKRPLAVAKLFAIKAARSWYGTDSQRFETLIMPIQIAYLFMILWSTRAAWKQGGTARQLAGSVWLIVLYFWAINVLSTTLVRYMVPAIGLLFVPLAALLQLGRCGIKVDVQSPA